MMMVELDAPRAPRCFQKWIVGDGGGAVGEGGSRSVENRRNVRAWRKDSGFVKCEVWDGCAVVGYDSER